MKLTQEKLKKIIDYNHDTGIFTWKIKKGSRITIGQKAGSISKNGYINIRINNKNYLAHRLAFMWMEGYFPENGIDHIDRNKTNNKWENLREASKICNARNTGQIITNKSGVKGVCLKKNKYQSQIKINNKNFYLGIFENIIDAAKARWEAEVKYNFPNCNTTSSAYNYLKEHGAI